MSKQLCGWVSDTHYCIREWPHEGMPHIKAEHHGTKKP